MRSAMNGLLIAALMAVGCTKKAPVEAPLVHRDAVLAYQLQLPHGWRASDRVSGITVAAFTHDHVTTALVTVEKMNVESPTAYWKLLPKMPGAQVLKAGPSRLGGRESHRSELLWKEKGQVAHRILHIVLKDGLAFQFCVNTVGELDDAFRAKAEEFFSSLTWLAGVSQMPRRKRVHANRSGPGWQMIGNVWRSADLGLRVDMSDLATGMGSAVETFGVAFEGSDSVSGAYIALTIAPPWLTPDPNFQIGVLTETDQMRFVEQSLSIQSQASAGGRVFYGFTKAGKHTIEIKGFCPKDAQAKAAMQRMLDRFEALTAADEAQLARPAPAHDQVAGDARFGGRQFYDRALGVLWRLPDGVWHGRLKERAAALHPGTDWIAVDMLTATTVRLLRWSQDMDALMALADRPGDFGDLAFDGRTLKVRARSTGSYFVGFQDTGDNWVAEVSVGRDTPSAHAFALRCLQGFGRLGVSLNDVKNNTGMISRHTGIAFKLPSDLAWEFAPDVNLSDWEQLHFFTSRGPHINMVRAAVVPYPETRQAIYRPFARAMLREAGASDPGEPSIQTIGAHRVEVWHLDDQRLWVGLMWGPMVAIAIRFTGSKSEWTQFVRGFEFVEPYAPQ